MKRALAASLAFHLGLIALLFAAAFGLGRMRPTPRAVEPPRVEVVMGQSGEAQETRQGAAAPHPPPPQPQPPPAPPPAPQPPPQEAPPPPAPPPPAPPPAAPPPPPPPPSPSEASLPPPPPPPPAPKPAPPQPSPPKPAPPQPPAPKAAPAEKPPAPPAVNLGTLAAGAAGIEDPSHTLVPAKAERGNFPPTYPRAAAVRGEHGTVKLRIHVGADGGVTAVDVVGSSGSAALDKAARDAILKWRYQPAQDANGNPAPDVVDLSVEFQLN